MRKEHEIEKKFNIWKKAGYGNSELSAIQDQEVKRAFMGGVFEGLNFVIEQMDNPRADFEIQALYQFLKYFHDNEVAMSRPPFGKKYY